MKAGSNLEKVFAAGHFALTSELGPPKGNDVSVIQKKVDFLRANPRIWGQIVDDRGYMAGKCSHAYRCLMFWGQAEFVQDAVEKRRALVLMCEQLEPNPASVAHKLVGPFDNVAILRLRVEGMTAKESPPPKKG